MAWFRNRAGAMEYDDTPDTTLPRGAWGGYGLPPGYRVPRPDAAAPAAPDRSLLMSSLGGAPHAGVAGPAVMPQGALAPNRGTRSQAEIQQRLVALVRAGVLDPRNLIDPASGRVRPDVWAQLDALGPYRGPDAAAPPLPPYAGDQYGGEFINPNELRSDEWMLTHMAGLETADVARSGYYDDPATGTRRPTVEYQGQLMDRFGTARNAEAQYRGQVASAAANATTGAQGVDQAEQNMNALKARIEAERGQNYSPDDVAAMAAARRAVDQAQMSYNRARGVGGQIQQPITVGQLGQGLSEEQFGALATGVGAGYSGQELEDLRRGIPGAQNQRRYQPYYDYRRAAQARGVGF